MRRTPVIVALAALLVAGGAADRVWRHDDPATSVDAAGMPTAAPGSALSSTWYCGGGSGSAESPYVGGLTVANPTDAEVHGTVIMVPDQGDSKSVPFTLKASSATSLPFADTAPAAYVAATVDVDSGQVAVEHWIAGKAGHSVAPCASAPSTNWYFADGATAKDAQLVLSLYNPFPEDAIADLSFTTNEGRAVPASLQGIVVPAGRVVVRDLGEHVRRRDFIATHVVLRSGRVVADQLLSRTAPGEAGVSLRLGAPAPRTTWYFPDGYHADGISEEISVFNPGEEEALVDIEVTLDEGEAEPFELTVPPRGRASVVSGSEDRLPKGVARSAVVRSINNVPVVAERSVSGAAPAARLGRSDVLGGTRTARVWAFPWGTASATTDQWVVVHNPGGAEARVSIGALADGQVLAIDGLQDQVIPSGGRRAYRVGEHIQRDALSLVLRSNVAVVAERLVFAVGFPGIADSLGIPLA